MSRERRLVKAAKKFLKDHLKQQQRAAAWPPADDPLPGPHDDVPAIDPDTDFFTRAAEFRMWLHETRGVAVTDLMSEEARESFRAFAAAWAARRLPLRFYDGTVADAPAPRAAAAASAWGFARRAAAAGKADDPDARAAARAASHADARAWRRDRAQEADDLAPKPTPGTHDARVAARAARRDGEAAAAASPDRDAFVDEGLDTFARARAAEAARTAARDARMAVKHDGLRARAAAAQAAEDAKMAALRALAAAGPITIARRAPPPPE